MGVCAAPAVLVPESFRTLACVAPSVNARTARAFLFIRLPALQYVYLSDYGSLRLRWNQEPDGPASLFCEAVVVYFLRSRFRHPSNELNFSACASMYLRVSKLQKLCQRGMRECVRHVSPVFIVVLAIYPYSRQPP